MGEHCVHDDKETVLKVGRGCSVWEVWALSRDQLVPSAPSSAMQRREPR